MAGWISLHRRIMDKAFYKKPEYLALWVHILLKCNHKDNEFIWNKETIIIKKGSFLTGRKSLSEEIGINPSKVERILKYLEIEQQIEQQKTTKFRIIRVINWEFYQNEKDNEQQIEQQMNNKRTTDEQQMNTNNNDNNDNNENKKDIPKKHKYGNHKNVLLTDKEFEQLKVKFNGKHLDHIENLSEGIALKGYKYKSHYLAILKWNKNATDKKSNTTSSWKQQVGDYDEEIKRGKYKYG